MHGIRGFRERVRERFLDAIMVVKTIETVP